MKILNGLKTNLIYKLVAFILAVITYIYVQNELISSGRIFHNKELLKQLDFKVVPIKVALKGEPPPRYQILTGNIKVKPEKVIIVGKKSDLDKISEISTQEIDVRKFTHTQILYVPLKPVENAIVGDKAMVEIEIPVVAVR
ncbi:MAG TPA: YbbR-like domain-containing protein [Candidatus Omnitrophica bacterium]|nr:YbbR-like domain-containing protein [Candidatus Omnitrophota bacterium]